VFPPCLFVVHNASGGGEDDEAELTGRQKLNDPLLHIAELDVKAGADHTSLIDAAIELDDDLAGAVIIDLLKFANIAMLLHNGQKLDNDLGARPDQDLALARLLGVVDGVERIVEDGCLDHCGGMKRFSTAGCGMRYL